eukprot:6139048-Amphidinium_carterae.1
MKNGCSKLATEVFTLVPNSKQQHKNDITTGFLIQSNTLSKTGLGHQEVCNAPSATFLKVPSQRSEWQD